MTYSNSVTITNLWYLEMSIQASIREQLQLIQSGADKPFNSFISIVDEQSVIRALDDIRPPPSSRILEGFTLTVKDNIEVAGLRCTGGTRALQDFLPKRDATAVTRVKNAGAIVMGKANMHELALGGTSVNHAYQPVGNACNADYIAGGSSGGTATAIAAGFVRGGLGTDTGGSNRIPAALNGIVGFRPTTGRYPNDGVLLLSNTRDTIGPMGLNVGDVALLDAVLSEDEPVLHNVDISSLKLGVPHAYFYDNLDPDVARIMNDAHAKLKASGITLVENDIPDVGELNKKVGFPVVLYEIGQLIPQYLKKNNIAVTMAELHDKIASPDVKKVIGQVVSGVISESVYREAIEVHRPKLQKAFSDYFKQYEVDAIIFPATPLPARPIKEIKDTIEFNGQEVSTFLTYIRNMDPSGNAGIPGLTLPAGNSRNGLPIGLELEGPTNSDRRLLAIGQLLEKILATKQ